MAKRFIFRIFYSYILLLVVQLQYGILQTKASGIVSSILDPVIIGTSGKEDNGIQASLGINLNADGSGILHTDSDLPIVNHKLVTLTEEKVYDTGNGLIDGGVQVLPYELSSAVGVPLKPLGHIANTIQTGLQTAPLQPLDHVTNTIQNGLQTALDVNLNADQSGLLNAVSGLQLVNHGVGTLPEKSYLNQTNGFIDGVAKLSSINLPPLSSVVEVSSQPINHVVNSVQSDSNLATQLVNSQQTPIVNVVPLVPKITTHLPRPNILPLINNPIKSNVMTKIPSLPGGKKVIKRVYQTYKTPSIGRIVPANTIRHRSLTNETTNPKDDANESR